MKIEKSDKMLFKQFKKTKFPPIDNELRETIYFYLLGYVTQVLRFRSKGIWVYGFSKIELCQQDIDKFAKIANGDSKTLEYLELAKQTTERLNKYIVGVDDPFYMRIMKNYEHMKKILRSVPHFHDAYIIDCKKKENDVYITFGLYTVRWLFPMNAKIYELNPKYRHKENQITITIKFANVELLEGTLDKDWTIEGSMYFLMDLEYETISDIKHRFDLSGCPETMGDKSRQLVFNCEHIEFVEN